jgi:type VI secretion system protein ImpH
VASEKRQPGASLKERLFKEFYGFSFFKAVHLLELLFPGKKPLGQTPAPGEEVVRFSVRPGFTFPPSDISNLRHEDEKRPVDMEVTFMGLIGPSGVLPHWYNEHAMERIRQKDFTLIAFLDIFHHRLISLFFLAWRKYRFPENYLPGAKDRLSKHLLSLIGLGTSGFAGRIGLPQESLIYYSGLLSREVPSAVAIEAAVEYFSDTHVEVEQFIDRVILFSTEDQTQLGLANGQLGIDAVCGSSAWEGQTKFRIHLGPMGYDQFLSFLPSGKMLRPIFSLVRTMAGIEYEFEIRLFLRREEVPPCVLGIEPPASPRLGWTTWLKTPGFAYREDPYVTFEEPEPLLKS